jgi:hypothetical protein
VKAVKKKSSISEPKVMVIIIVLLLARALRRDINAQQQAVSLQQDIGLVRTYGQEKEAQQNLVLKDVKGSTDEQVN